MKVEILKEKFDPWQILADYQATMVASNKLGATVVFVGTMRDFNENEEVSSLFLEHYPEMTSNYLKQIALREKNEHGVSDILLIHRVGVVYPSEPIVLVAVWSAHRREAYLANRGIMEDLKANAPFWKKECLQEGERWIKHNTPG